jgi:hypothetical protein
MRNDEKWNWKTNLIKKRILKNSNQKNGNQIW